MSESLADRLRVVLMANGVDAAYATSGSHWPRHGPGSCKCFEGLVTDLLVAAGPSMGALRAPIADLVERVIQYGFPRPEASDYAAAIDAEAERFVKALR